MLKVKDKERILKAAREKQLVTFRGFPIRLSANFSKEICCLEETARNIQSHEKQGSTFSNLIQDCSTQQRYHVELKDR